MLHLRISLLLLGSGMSALLYQTAWQRSFRLIFGATTGASAAVLSVFMAGLGLGGWWLGRRVERRPRPLEYYARLEFGVCLVAAVSPFTTKLLGQAYLALGGEPRLGLWGATFARLLVAVLVMGPAAWFMGGTLPAAARAAETEQDASRRHLALLYALNTTGAVIGSVIGTFALFELLGTRLSLWFGCLINLLVAVVARAWARTLPETPVASRNEEVGHGESPIQRAERLAAYLAAGLVGIAFMGSELVWYRVASPLLEGSTYSFGLILAVALSGIGLGAWLYSRHSDARITWALLAITVLGEAFCLGLPLWLGDSLAIFAIHLRNLAALGFGALILAWAIVCAVIVFPVALVAGYQFPVLIALLGRGRHQVAAHVGKAYLYNTAGSVLGSLLVGFVLLPRVGAIRTWRGLIVALLVVALLALFWAWRRRELRLTPSLLLIGLLACGSIGSLRALGPTAAWRHSPIGAGRVLLSGSDANALRNWLNTQRRSVFWERDGVDVSVAMSNEAGISFIVSGKCDGNVQSDRGTQAMSGLMAALLHPNPKQGFVLGLGTGMSAGWLAKALEHVDVAELEPAIVEVARSVGAANGNVLSAKNVNIFLGDGREFLLTTHKLYDIMMSEPSNPYRAGVASLYTVEFYRTVRQHLAPQGIFVQWLQGYEIDTSVVLLTLRTLREVYPLVEIWQSQDSDIVFLASTEPRNYDIQRIRERAQTAPYLEVMRRTWLQEGAEALFSHVYGNAKFVDKLIARNEPPCNTDDENLLEFAVARTAGNSHSNAGIDLYSLALASGADEVSLTNGHLDREEIRSVRPRNFLISGGSLPGDLIHLHNARSALFESGCVGNGRSPLAPKSDFPAPHDLIEAFAYGRVLALRGAEAVLPLAERLEKAAFTAEAGYLRGLYEEANKHPELALGHYERALIALRDDTIPLCDIASQLVDSSVALAQRHPDWVTRIARELNARPFIAYLIDNKRIAAAQQLAFASSDPQLCVEALGKDLLVPTWTKRFLAARMECLERARHPLAKTAERQFAEYLEKTSGDYGLAVEKPKPEATAPNSDQPAQSPMQLK
jgi:spermidine synthase